MAVNNSVLVTTDHQLLAFGRSGAKTVLATFPSEAIVSGPSMTPNGDYIVATDEALYALRLQK